MESYQISENIALPIRGDNILRLGFQPFKLCQDDLLSGLEEGQSLNGGKHFVKKDGNNVKFYYCKLNEGYGLDKTKTPKSADLHYDIPDWVHSTGGSCQYSTRKPSDLGKHLVGVHSLAFANYAFLCTHCPKTFLDQSRARTHMNSCKKLWSWATESRVKNPIKPEFFRDYEYWTCSRTVNKKRPKNGSEVKDEDLEHAET